MVDVTSLSGNMELGTNEEISKSGQSSGDTENDQNINNQADMSGSDDLESPKKKTKVRRARKRKYKPYYKLSWNEREAIDMREAKRAQQIRDKRFALGQPVAPYNTTQFLMDEHQVEYNDALESWPPPLRHRDNSLSVGDSDEDFYSSPEDEEDFLHREFVEQYSTVYADRLAAMSKTELIQELLQLDEKVDTLEQNLKKAKERRLEEMKREGVDIAPGEVSMDPETAAKIRIFEQEISKLESENLKLLTENRLLKDERQMNYSCDTESDSSSSVSTTTTGSESDSDDRVEPNVQKLVLDDNGNTTPGR